MIKRIEHFYDHDAEHSTACPINYAVELISHKWVIPILCTLNQNGIMRYTELKNAVSGITNPILSNVLKKLEAADLVHREQYNEMPLRVEYELTQYGREVLPSLFNLAEWGFCVMQRNDIECTCHDTCYNRDHMFLDKKQADRLSSYPRKWDEGYLAVWEELQSPGFSQASAKEKLTHFLIKMLDILTAGDLEFNRLLLVYMHGLGNANLIDTTRPHYAILNELITQGKEEGSITKEKSNLEIANYLLKMVGGMESEWVINGGVFDVIADNKDCLVWLVESLKP